MKKICFVIQRYGLEVNGGAELHCRMLAERLTGSYEVSVITTKAVDYVTWADDYRDNEENLNGVHVLRFSVDKPRDQKSFDEINGRFQGHQLKHEEEQEWIEKQGPCVPDLVKYLEENKDRYDVFIFMAYLYYHSVMGIPVVKDKAIFLPLAHDEPFLRIKKIREEFYMPRAFFFNTEEERKLVRTKFRNYEIPYMIGGTGAELPEDIDPDRFRKKYGLDNFIIYIGRIDEGKNCGEMFYFFRKFKQAHPSDLKLVLMGKAVIDIPKDKDIIPLGFVSDQDKFDGLAASRFLVLPSKFESLSMVVLEAFSLRKPVLVNGRCEVLKAHCINSNGGFYYHSYEEFEELIQTLLADEKLRLGMGEKGKAYVKNNYRWNVIISKLSMLIDYVTENPVA